MSISNKEFNCIREVSNFSKIKLYDRFDSPKFDKERFIKELEFKSPKLVSLLGNIAELDKRDYTKEKKLYKHFIFSDLKKGYGAKVITTAMIAAGYSFVLKKSGSKIVIDKDRVGDLKDDSKFAVLSSTSMWNIPFKPNTVKDILSVFNSRPDNIYGDKIRFIILDSGFKEGIDLFDVKYAHIFEDQMYASDLTQSIGRAVRYCGQKGLEYSKPLLRGNRGWNLDVFVYKLYRLNKGFFKSNKEIIIEKVVSMNKEINYKTNFEKDLLRIVKESSVDYELNKNINGDLKTGLFSKIKKVILPIAGISLFVTSVILRQHRSETNKENLTKLMVKLGKRKK